MRSKDRGADGYPSATAGIVPVSKTGLAAHRPLAQQFFHLKGSGLLEHMIGSGGQLVC